jgi:dihydrofolate reductase
MKKIVVTEFISLDGVFEAPGPEGAGYKYEGWTFPYSNDEFMQFKMAELMAADIQLLGRVTYDGFAKAWPEHSGDEFSDKFNSMPKYVVSQTLEKAEWNNSHIIRDNIAKEIQKLKEGEGGLASPKSSDGGGDILVAGSGQLVRFMLDKGMIDQINLLMYPVVLGTGKKLFEGAQKEDLQLVESQAFDTGVMKFIYEPKR